MTDEAIMDLYWQRREEAIAATEEKYGGYCRTIARNILADPQDAEECARLQAEREAESARRLREADEILHGKPEDPQKPDSPDPF